ncbi:hypothetical protein [Mycolicibacterium confluentis]|uniref:Uncharacterized protein n=1 Tax=Mycolicibacterium confluentis TaxID=28047 RepID=A0A7I7Y0L5_9MYCO|nr:hypothetical protein [Mycolicibacterium confluentis]MCV7319864.1 hypothetical protein [Mycolicibacterium confluentis]ORV34434.1 hypothetical protein AWB99_02110 [Mycolicibacterium confluentis]BBZ34894.1 hypothetical protein MCNF_34990 [Mycolicibacterium confluentis]
MSTVVCALAVAVLAGWHLRTRRHPGWRLSRDGRFYIVLGYPMLMIGLYWLIMAPTMTGWQSVLGDAWAFAAMVTFVYGFAHLQTTVERRNAAGQSLESIATEPQHAAPQRPDVR